MAPLNEMTKFICLFHHVDRASAAVRALRELGLPDDAVSTMGSGEGTADLNGEHALTGLGVPDRDLEHLRDGLRRGGVLVSLTAPEDRTNEIERVFHRYSADKIDEASLHSTLR